MRVRKPDVDFSQTSARWAPHGEFAQQMNASSLWIPHLERFLNRVMSQANAKLDASNPRHAQLKADIRTFIRQEGNHTALHAAFNAILPRAGYDIAHFERHFEAEFKRLLATKSFKFLCAYCEGFETLGPPMALVWLDEIEDLIGNADQNVVTLWKWHLMEEYEHRTVCHDVARMLGVSYFQRIHGFFFQLKHLQGMSRMVKDYLFAQDALAMTPEQVAEMHKRSKAVGRKVMKLALPRILKALLPFHDPRKDPEPRAYRSYMAKIETALV